MRKLISSIILFSIAALCLGQTHIIPDNEFLINGEGNYAHINPGDTLYIKGTRNILILSNFKGTKDKPIVLTNSPGEILQVNSNTSFGISVQGVKHFNIVGTPVNGDYGIQVVVEGGVGVGIGYLSQEWLLKGIEIGPTKSPGILAKTDPNCDFNSTRDKFLQYGGAITHCYIHDTGTEGIYYGSSAYEGYTTHCNGIDSVVKPHLITHGEIAYNYVENSGWDAIQVASALKTSIHHNTIVNDSKKRQQYHMNGIIAGLGFSGHIYNNLIINGEGNGIFSKARDSLIIENNVILNPGFSQGPGSGQYGIYLNIENPEAKWLQVNNNLIANPRYQAFHAVLGDNVLSSYFINNIISYNDSLTGDSNELISTPQNLLTQAANNIIRTEDQLDIFYWNTDSLDQRNNGFTTDQGILPPIFETADFYDRPRNGVLNQIDIGPFEFQEIETHIDEANAASNCESFFREINFKVLPENTSIFDLSGKAIPKSNWQFAKTGYYILVHKSNMCHRVVYKQ